ncbi:hypothetical protein VPFG_00088 [Vibrio phage nt-1]|uniref:Uncharacterized protein n=1 Tax=Vibrio phage nt-1 TaxID=115992 RepID=R9TIA8_9CAUD|nr:hypothetical protein VPFG_00088 [Vibrio phage nt-1]AGN30090.1 hypothetical protein VPFG_00088 [Vibrio phage nt-1]
MAKLVEVYSTPAKKVNIAGVELVVENRFNYVTIDQSGTVWAYEDSPSLCNDGDGAYWDVWSGESDGIAQFSDVTEEEFTKLYEV